MRRKRGKEVSGLSWGITWYCLLAQFAWRNGPQKGLTVSGGEIGIIDLFSLDVTSRVLLAEQILSCIPCGHVYGRLCLEKWLNKCGNKGKCPQCNGKFNPKQIINLFAPRIVVPNDDLEKEVTLLREKIELLTLENARLLEETHKQMVPQHGMYALMPPPTSGSHADQMNYMMQQLCYLLTRLEAHQACINEELQGLKEELQRMDEKLQRMDENLQRMNETFQRTNDRIQRMNDRFQRMNDRFQRSDVRMTHNQHNELSGLFDEFQVPANNEDGNDGNDEENNEDGDGTNSNEEEHDD